MRVRRGIPVVVCTGILLATAPVTRPQEATSANLPEQVESDEASSTPKLKTKKARPRKVVARQSSERPAPAVKLRSASEEPATPAAPVEKKHRVKKRTASSVQPEAVALSTPTSLSLSAAQAMAVSAPLPEYPYEAKHANVTGNGVCVMTVDTASGKVTDAMMAQSTGNRVLDKVTTETFRRWRFKPGTVWQVRVPVTYE